MIDDELLNYLEDFISEERKERFSAILKNRTRHITVAIEDVFQMHNTSAVVRSCEIFGVQEAHLIEKRNSLLLDENIAMGAQKWVDVTRYTSSKDCIAKLKNEGFKIIATTPHNDSCLLDDFKVEGKTALFFGTERDGLSDEVMNQADGFLKIPMLGFTESLNISVSAAIILQNLSDKIRNTDIDWGLTEDDKKRIRLDWTKKSIKSIDDILKRYYASTK